MTTPKVLTFPLGDAVLAAVTTAVGGCSRGEYESLNLSFAVHDDPDHVEANRAAVAAEVGYEADALVVARLVHGATVTVIDERHAGAGAHDQESGMPATDALVTSVPGIPLSVLVADCAPILLADQARRAVGVAHAGWRGAAARVVQQTIATMTTEYGTNPEDLRVVIGPHIAVESFEMGEEEARECALAFPEAAVVHDGYGVKPHVDLRAMLMAQLREAGVQQDRIVAVDADTLTSSDFFSHRRSVGRSGATGGRFAGIIALA